MLSDGTIRRLLANPGCDLNIVPSLDLGALVDSQFQPASVDLRLGWKVMHHPSGAEYIMEDPDGYALYAGQCLLGTTSETLELPANMVARIEGKSTLGRSFISVHSTAGFIDPGFKGQITLEIKNEGHSTFQLRPGMRICQVSFDWLDVEAERPYGHPALGSRYQNQRGPTPAVP